jgi:hypothetical protein
MANQIVAGNSSNGGTAISTDTSGTLNIVTGSGSGATAVAIDGSQNLQFNSGYGSAATAYGCRAWVNFNGTGTVAIRASGNVTSITDNGTGDYTVNFTNTMPDANYAYVFGGSLNRRLQLQNTGSVATTSTIRVQGQDNANSAADVEAFNVAIFR